MPTKDKRSSTREWLTSAEAAELVHVHTKTIERACRSGLLVAERAGRNWMVKRDALIEFWRASLVGRPDLKTITSLGAMRRNRAPLRRAATR